MNRAQPRTWRRAGRVELQHPVPHDLQRHSADPSRFRPAPAFGAYLAEMAATQALAPWKRLDERLHRIVAQASHNTLLLLLYDTLRDQGRVGLDARIEAVFGATLAPSMTAIITIANWSRPSALMTPSGRSTACANISALFACCSLACASVSCS